MKNFRRRTGLALATAAVTACSLLSPVAATAQSSAEETASTTTAATSTTSEPGDPADGATSSGENGKPAGDPTPTNSPEPPAPGDSSSNSSSSETAFEANPEFKAFCDATQGMSDEEFAASEFAGKSVTINGNAYKGESARKVCENGDMKNWIFPSPEFDKGLGIFNAVLAVLTAVAGVVGFIFKLNPNLINDIKGALKI
ncbi:hypothetical protein CFRA_07925 [Corynebacterium frankenforstense DSM 45800]|uniref:Secreted protein n=1 Tax=Corynebacterium frankenforstense DSM 45800 TaxID=1437875 RepID=A0A1L7CTN7_9CORY|nr:hypothetical protein [Corynebacterium frankenforstense]APT89197.1 hypothetical protein CFRA_07925 [Corynebacterium frankenforstense DSM 45800]